LEKFFQIDGKKYSTEGLSPDGLKLVSLIRFTQNKISNLSNQHSLLMKAKNAYIFDIKSEVVESKSGLDLGALFTKETDW
jgi:hypothetical protein